MYKVLVYTYAKEEWGKNENPIPMLVQWWSNGNLQDIILL